MRELRYALRALRRAPGFSIAAALTLGLGIGANSAIFSLIHSAILKPPPYREPSRLIVAWDTYQPQKDVFPRLGASPAEIGLWSAQTDIFQGTAWYRYVPLDLDLTADGGEPEAIHAATIAENLPALMGVAPRIGRAFRSGEAPDSVLLGDRLWRTRYASDPRIAGKTIRLNGAVFTIRGVMPPDFKFPDWADAWLAPGPLMGDELTNPVRHATGFIARLAPGVSPRAAEVRLEALSRRLAAENPKTSTGWGMRVSTLQDDLTASIRPALWMLWGAVGLVLLIACANAASLMLARGAARSREIALRAALGAGAWRIARQLLIESLLLSAAGGALGLALAEGALKALSPLEAPLDVTVLGYLAAISGIVGVVFGLAPVIHALHFDPNAALKSGSAAVTQSSKLRSALVIGEIALAVILVSSAATLLESFRHLIRVDPGFDPRGVLTARISYPSSRNAEALFHRIEERVRNLAGVEAFASIDALPLNPSRAHAARFNVPGSPLIDPDALPAAQFRRVSPDYFATLRIPLRAGRGFTVRDLNQPVAIVNETMARRFWPGKNPVGLKFITGPWGPAPTWSTIIGVAGDVKQFGLDSGPTLDIYFPALDPSSLAIRTAGDPLALAAAVRSAIHAADPDVPVFKVRSMDEILADSGRERRWVMFLLGAFAGAALALALVGIYGVMSWTVTQRTREIGIRVALGARSAGVLRPILGFGARLSLAGLALGFAAAFAARGLLAAFVFGVSTADPRIYAGAAGAMLSAAMLACYLPARRALRVDPQTALRSD